MISYVNNYFYSQRASDSVELMRILFKIDIKKKIEGRFLTTLLFADDRVHY